MSFTLWLYLDHLCVLSSCALLRRFPYHPTCLRKTCLSETTRRPQPSNVLCSEFTLCSVTSHSLHLSASLAASLVCVFSFLCFLPFMRFRFFESSNFDFTCSTTSLRFHFSAHRDLQSLSSGVARMFVRGNRFSIFNEFPRFSWGLGSVDTFSWKSIENIKNARNFWTKCYIPVLTFRAFGRKIKKLRNLRNFL